MNHDPRDPSHDDPPDDPRDAHLQRALRHAPDADSGPPPVLSEAILREARDALAAAPIHSAPVVAVTSVTPAVPATSGASGFSGASGIARALRALIQLWSQLGQPRWAGAIAGLMVATLVGVMWWGQPMERAVQGAPEIPEATRTTDTAGATVPSGAAPIDQVQGPSQSNQPAAPPPAAAVMAEAVPATTQTPPVDRPAMGPVSKGAPAAREEKAIARAPQPAEEVLAKRKSTSADAPVPARGERPESELSARTRAPQAAHEPSVAETAPTTAMADARGGNVEQRQVAAPAPQAKAALSTTPAEAAATLEATPPAARRARESLLARQAAGAPTPAAPGMSTSTAAAAKKPSLSTAATLLAELRRTVAAQPERWSWRLGDAVVALGGAPGGGQAGLPADGAMRPISAQLQSWLARLDAAAVPVDSPVAAETPAALHLWRDARPHSTLHWGDNSVRLVQAEAPAAVWRAALPGPAMLELQVMLAQLAR